MKKIRLQLLIFSCILIEAFMLFKIINSEHLFTTELFTCIAILVMLIMLKLINHLSNNTYEREKKNKFD
jgi:hypothetical protein